MTPLNFVGMSFIPMAAERGGQIAGSARQAARTEIAIVLARGIAKGQS